MQEWLLLDSKTSSAVYNMALDDALLDYAYDNDIPILRFYKWIRPTLSIGYFQKADNAVNFDKIKSKNFDFIRRPTGGRAVLHDKEITYSITIPIKNIIFNLSILESYDLLCKPIVQAINNLGIKAYISDEDESSVNSPSCFAAPTFKDIKVNGKKIIGSAQMRDKRGILQHGSILLKVSLDDIFEVLKLNYLKIDILTESKKKISCLIDEGFNKTEEDLKSEIVNCYESLLGIKFSSIIDSDIINIDKFMIKYSSNEWNYRI